MTDAETKKSTAKEGAQRAKSMVQPRSSNLPKTLVKSIESKDTEQDQRQPKGGKVASINAAFKELEEIDR